MNCYFQDIEYHIIEQIKKAENRLLIAVAWFTNKAIGVEILHKKEIDIEIVVDDNEKNRTCPNLLMLKAENIDISFIKDLNKNYYLMHNKFCVIDSKCVISGSYNWTQQANQNDENISIILDDKIAAHYSQEFRRIKNLNLQAIPVTFTEHEIEEITNLIYFGLLDELREQLTKTYLEPGSIYHWTDIKILNKIKTIEERTRNKINLTAGSLNIYFNLVKKYGCEFQSNASEKEKVLARDSFFKEGAESIDFNVSLQFKFFKIKAIKNLQNNYGKLLDSSIREADKIDRILKVFMYLNNEKISLANDLNINLI